jgi:hypothetical protein
MYTIPTMTIDPLDAKKSALEGIQPLLIFRPMA